MSRYQGSLGGTKPQIMQQSSFLGTIQPGRPRWVQTHCKNAIKAPCNSQLHLRWDEKLWTARKSQVRSRGACSTGEHLCFAMQMLFVYYSRSTTIDMKDFKYDNRFSAGHGGRRSKWHAKMPCPGTTEMLTTRF